MFFKCRDIYCRKNYTLLYEKKVILNLNKNSIKLNKEEKTMTNTNEYVTYKGEVMTYEWYKIVKAFEKGDISLLEFKEMMKNK